MAAPGAVRGEIRFIQSKDSANLQGFSGRDHGGVREIHGMVRVLFHQLEDSRETQAIEEPDRKASLLDELRLQGLRNWQSLGCRTSSSTFSAASSSLTGTRGHRFTLVIQTAIQCLAVFESPDVVSREMPVGARIWGTGKRLRRPAHRRQFVHNSWRGLETGPEPRSQPC